MGSSLPAKIKDDDLMHFLDNVYPEMEGALQSN